MSDLTPEHRALVSALSGASEDQTFPVNRIENHIRIFHAECGGQVTGPLSGPWICTECGEEMRRLVSDSDRVELRKEKATA
jgi:hypothetical protein